MSNKNKIKEPEQNLPFIDVHCHLPFPRPRNDKLPSDESQLKTYFDLGGVFLITSTIDIKTLNLTLEFIKEIKNEEYSAKYGFTCGWAPQTVTYTPKNQYKNDWNKWKEFVINNSEKFLAIGEIGLDFHHAKTLEKRQKQINVFKKILEFTKELKKPYVLHVRNAASHEKDNKNPTHRFNDNDGATKEVISILGNFNITPKRVMWHCFSGPKEYGNLLPQKGFTLSVPSSSFGFNRWRNVTEESPLDSLVTETDSYYQHPFKRGPLNVPANVRYSIAAISHTHNVGQKKIADITVKNALEFFKIKLI
ncbi:MAG: TatD family deoxyribonuclease [Promethearchaeota archaeon]|nr:MAG: TatD family deoxyribonuclease [Candidatus Lokiarchaeota archaeon]